MRGMFTGIIEELGEVKNISKRSRVSILTVLARNILEDANIGDSIAVNGVCLTVSGKKNDSLNFEIMPETLRTSTLGWLRPRDKLNLERALKLGQRISGHFVTGHIDCLGIIRGRRGIGGDASFDIAVPVNFIKYILPKGSISVDGISLTIAYKMHNIFRVCLIPHTLKNTALQFRGHSDKVNIEFDLLAKK